ncbi:hypothetical protein C2E23DRAFT_216106 [Lenzites betulinus]|nr:hypothetical protein C2E23DRAFT_216106 [Lenzites betulinus]
MLKDLVNTNCRLSANSSCVSILAGPIVTSPIDTDTEPPRVPRTHNLSAARSHPPKIPTRPTSSVLCQQPFARAPADPTLPALAGALLGSCISHPSAIPSVPVLAQCAAPLATGRWLCPPARLCICTHAGDHRGELCVLVDAVRRRRRAPSRRYLRRRGASARTYPPSASVCQCQPREGTRPRADPRTGTPPEDSSPFRARAEHPPPSSELRLRIPRPEDP